MIVLRNGIARFLLGLGMILISLALKIDPVFTKSTISKLTGGE
ncbi:hypothetical protein ES703_91507 [subsurface metagenome]